MTELKRRYPEAEKAYREAYQRGYRDGWNASAEAETEGMSEFSAIMLGLEWTTKDKNASDNSG